MIFQTNFYTPTLTKQQICAAYTDRILEELSQRDDLHPYFVTTVFREFQASTELPLRSQIWLAQEQYDRVYRHIVSALIRNFHKKRYLHPLTYDFLDLPGCRKKDLADASAPRTPHFHSVYLINSQTHARWIELIDENFKHVVRHPKLNSLISIHAKPVPPPDLEKVVAYSSKLLENRKMLALNNDIPLYNQFPITREEQQCRQNTARQNRLLKVGQLPRELQQELLQKQRSVGVGNPAIVRSSVNRRTVTDKDREQFAAWK